MELWYRRGIAAHKPKHFQSKITHHWVTLKNTVLKQKQTEINIERNLINKHFENKIIKIDRSSEQIVYFGMVNRLLHPIKVQMLA